MKKINYMIIKYNKFIKLNENNDDKFFVNLSDEEFNEILNKNCKEYLKNRVVFYRGDNSLKGNHYIINTKNIKRREGFEFNHYSNVFTSSDLWKNKNLPLRKNSVDFTNDKQLSYRYSDTSYNLIPLDGAKIVCLPYIFNNYCNPKVHEEFKELGKIYTRSGKLEAYKFNELLYALSRLNGIYLDRESDINTVTKSLISIQNTFFNNKNIINKELEEKLKKDLDGNLFNNIFNIMKENMEKHNMSFMEYMVYLYSPDNYTIMNYKDMTNNNIKEFSAFYTDSDVLMSKF